MNTWKVCKDFIRLYCKGQEVEPIQSATKMDNIWGLRVDWHEMGWALESLEHDGEATMVGLTGERMRRYHIN